MVHGYLTPMCHFSLFNELIPNAITINSQFRPGGKMDNNMIF